MAKTCTKTLLKEEANIEINIDQFNQLVSNLGKEDSKLKFDHILLIMPQGKRCRINPGIAFEIIDFNKNTSFPGFVHPIGKGCCDIYSDNGEATIDLFLNTDKNSSFGFCQNSKGKSTYGPFSRKNEKSPNTDFVCYFTHICNPIDSDPNSISYIPEESSHTLYVQNLCIIDFRNDVTKLFTGDTHWKDIYKDFIVIKNDKLLFRDEFFGSSDNVKTIDITKFVPQDQQINRFICRTKIGFKQNGSKIELTNGSTIIIPHLLQDDSIMYFSSPMPFLIIPEKPQKKLICFNFPSHLLAKECRGVGVWVDIKQVSNDVNLLFSKKRSSSVEEQNTKVMEEKYNASL